MLTDDQLSTIVNTSPCDGADVRCYRADFDKIIAQAREANALRAKLAEAKQQIAAQALVCDAAVPWRHQMVLSNRSTGEVATEESDRAQWAMVDNPNGRLVRAVDAYRDFFGSRPTNVPALISSMVVARVTTDEAGETTMQPATVGFTRWPASEPPRYNGQTEPCDMWSGPCSCGAWHQEGR